MPDFTFEGFATGAPVAIDVAQGGLTASGAVTGWGQGGSLAIAVTAPGAVTAPAGIWFEATGLAGFAAGGPGAGEVYDPRFHEITYVWDFGDAGSFAPALNMPTAWNDRNLAYGPQVAHVFASPGTYTVSVWAVDANGVTGSASTTVTVADPDTVYAGGKTIVFSNDPGETWAGAPAGAMQVTSLGALRSAIGSLDFFHANTSCRVLFRRGQTVSNFWLNLDIATVQHFAAWGSGADPVLQPQDGQFAFDLQNSAPVPQFTVTGLDLRGDWDAATETGYPTRSPFFFNQSPTDCHYVIHGCAFSGFSDIWLSIGSDRASTIVFSESTVTNWRDYGFYCEVVSTANTGAKLAFVGSSIAQNPDALNGGDKNQLYNTHGPLRIASRPKVYIGACDFFSRNGWSGLGSDTADQPCLRLNANALPNQFYNIDRVACEGGYVTIKADGHSGGLTENPGNFLIDRALCVASAKTIQPIQLAYGGTTVRNALVVVPNVPAYHGGNPLAAGVAYAPDTPAAGNADARMALYSSTFLNLRDAANDPGWAWAAATGTASFNVIAVENNLVHGPALDTPVAADAPVDVATPVAGFATRYKGVRFNFRHQTGTLAAAVPDGGSFTIPYASVTRAIYPQSGGTATDQAYWQAIAATDTKHAITIGSTLCLAARGQFAVSYDASVITVTNTSGASWGAGAGWNLRLDRSSLIPAMQAAFSNLGQTIPLARPQAGSAAVGAGGLGLGARGDFLTDPRAVPPARGALESA